MKAKIFLLVALTSIFVGYSALAAINIELRVFQGPRISGSPSSNTAGVNTPPPLSVNGKYEVFNVDKKISVLADADYNLKITGLNAGSFIVTQERIWPSSQSFPAVTFTAPSEITTTGLTGTFNSVQSSENYELWKIEATQGGNNGKLYFYLVRNTPSTPNDPNAVSDPVRSPAKNPASDCNVADRSKCQYQIQISKDGVANPTIDDPTKPGNDMLDLTVRWNKTYCPVRGGEFKGLEDWGKTDPKAILSNMDVQHRPIQNETAETQPWKILQIRDWHEPGKNYKENEDYHKFKPHIQFSQLENLKTFVIKLLPSVTNPIQYKKGTYVAQILGSELSNQAQFNVGNVGKPSCGAGASHSLSIDSNNPHIHTGWTITAGQSPYKCTWTLTRPGGQVSTLLNNVDCTPDIGPNPQYLVDKQGTYTLRFEAKDSNGDSCNPVTVVEKTYAYQCYFGFCYECNENVVGQRPPNQSCKVQKNQQGCISQFGNSCSVKIRE